MRRDAGACAQVMEPEVDAVNHGAAARTARLALVRRHLAAAEYGPPDGVVGHLLMARAALTEALEAEKLPHS